MLKIIFFFFLIMVQNVIFFFFSSRRRHTRFSRDWSSDVCSSDLDADHAEEGLDALVGVQEDRADPQLGGAFGVPVALLGDTLVLVGVEHVLGGERSVGPVGQVGGQRVQAVQPGGGGDRGGV